VRGPLLLIVLAGASSIGCGPPEPYIRYDGGQLGRTPKSVDAMEVLRTGPPAARHQDLGTVTVTCPSQLERGMFGTAYASGGCYYNWAIRKASVSAAAAGGDGIHSVESSTNAAGLVVSLRASVFAYLPKLAAPKPPEKPAEKPPGPTTKERLQKLEELKADNLITPEEYAKKRAEILDEI